MSPARTPEPPPRTLQSLRTILEGLILVALCWSANALTTAQTQLAVLQENVMQLRTQLADVPSMANRITRNEVRLDNLERRMGPVAP